MFALMKSRTSLKMGHVRAKTRSLGQMLEKPCVRCTGHIFSPIVTKPGQIVCLGEISYEFENGFIMSGQMLKKPVYALEATFSV